MFRKAPIDTKKACLLQSSTGGLSGHFLKQWSELGIPEADQGSLALEASNACVTNGVDLGADSVIVRSGNRSNFYLHPDRLRIAIAAPEDICQLIGVLVEGDGVDVVAERRTVAVVRKHGLRSRNDCRGTGIGNGDGAHAAGFLNGGGEATT